MFHFLWMDVLHCCCFGWNLVVSVAPVCMSSCSSSMVIVVCFSTDRIYVVQCYYQVFLLLYFMYLLSNIGTCLYILSKLIQSFLLFLLFGLVSFDIELDILVTCDLLGCIVWGRVCLLFFSIISSSSVSLHAYIFMVYCVFLRLHIILLFCLSNLILVLSTGCNILLFFILFVLNLLSAVLLNYWTHLNIACSCVLYSIVLILRLVVW